MSSSVAYLKPKTAGIKNLEYVWYSDTNAIIVDLSGNSSIRVNANDASNNLTKVTDSTTGSWDGVNWIDDSGNYYKNDVSGSDISGALFKHAFYVSNSNGTQTLTRVGTTGDKFSLPSLNLIDTLFTDQRGSPYYTSYKTNVPSSLQNPSVDLSLTTVGPIINNASAAAFNSVWTDISNNKFTIDCSMFRIGAINNNDASFNPVTVDVSFNFRTGYQLTSYASAKTDVSNNLYIKMYEFGVDVSTTPIVKLSTVVDQTSFIDISVNVLKAGSTLVIDTSGAGVISSQNQTLQPNVDLMNLLGSSYTFVNSGRQNLRIPFTIPASTSGCWIWRITLVDGNFVSSPVDLKLNVLPSFYAPNFSLSSLTNGDTNLLENNDVTRINLKVNDINFTPDISNNLTKGLRFAPRINALDSNITALDNSANLINQSLSVFITSIPTGNMLNNIIDISTNTLSFSDISNNNTDLVVRATDISLNDSGYFKNNDVSLNMDISYSDISQHNLPSRSYNLFVDWLPNGETSASSIITPQTLSIGTFNLATKYSSNCVIVDNLDGTYSLSLSDYNGDLSSARYRVRVFTDLIASTLASNSDLSLNAQTNILDPTDAANFVVTMDSDYNATFTGPNLVSNRNQKFYMVAYLEISTTTYLYTASNKVAFVYAKFPTLTMSFDTASAFTAADINKIISVDSNLDLNTALADLSGYAVKSVNVGIDLSCNLSLPLWELNTPVLSFSLTDTNSVVKSFDISGSNTRKSTNLPNKITTFTNYSDLSNGNFYIDLSYNSVDTTCLFSLNIALTDALGTSYPSANKTVMFYYPGFAPATSNLGNKKNTLIVYNDTKYIIDNVSTATKMSIGTMDSFNCYTWLAGSSQNSYCLNLARTEFVGGDNHELDISYFNVTSNSTGVTNYNTANIYIGYNGKWTGVKTGTTGGWSSAAPNVSGAASVVSSFARSTFSWIDMKKFVGTIDINFKTFDSNSNLSVNVNTLRLVVIPRPSLSLNITTPSNVLINTATNIKLNVRNIQNNAAGNPITFTSWVPVDISGNKALTSKLKTVLALTTGSLSLITSSGTSDITNASIFTLPSLLDITYGNYSNGVIVFKGRSVSGLSSSIVQAAYSAFGSKSVFTKESVSVAVYSTDSTYNNSVYTNNLITNNLITFAGMPFVQYVSLDSSNNAINLSTDTRTKNSAFVVIANTSAVTVNVSATNLTGSGGAVTISSNIATVPANSTTVYQHITGGAGYWSYLYSKQ